MRSVVRFNRTMPSLLDYTLLCRRCLSNSPNVESNPFHKDIAVVPLSAQENNKFRGYLTDKYNVGVSPNGGFSMSLALSSAEYFCEKAFPGKYPNIFSATAYYFNMANENSEAVFTVKCLNSGKSTANLQVSMWQQGQLKSRFLVIVGDSRQFKSINHNMLQPPILPPASQCIDASRRLREMLGERLKVANQYEFLVDPKSHFAQSTLKDKKTTEAEFQGWVRFPQKFPLCAKGLSFMCDSLPPPAHNLAPFSDSLWVPTIEYTVQIWNGYTHANTAHDSWYRCGVDSKFIANGFVQTDAQIWDESGETLLATSRQMARLYSPKS